MGLGNGVTRAGNSLDGPGQEETRGWVGSGWQGTWEVWKGVVK